MFNKPTFLLTMLRKMLDSLDCQIEVATDCEQHEYRFQRGCYSHTVPVDAMQLATMTPQQIELLAEDISERWQVASDRLDERLKAEEVQ